ncbi:solute carrier family 66 member 2-like isoform X1 [Anneissia japonica]|uniref:solute carrier family 66 member 2-like isoform X1 n=1 Tax=Anneissia japonica TaxID=1529436 RepID=UPI0014257B0F|nr:solute carrier family 66 member 2-like isoform X1 [Anneissia japonica]XP_033125236.1 solute carrier family 66 member 2-like isoform X1 [Anneissia japonica]XP_033125237.1 solute carrier family 66 member 2-like isoform X1 [Anneissia japonica]XP_033125238.1 solute carrier family 66 member 2-like isoform X1 [Anneissia japonica]
MDMMIYKVFLNLHQSLPELTLANLVSWIASASMMFGGIVPYIPQYLEIRKTDNADGFSTYVCLALILANLLRILFWFGHPFEFPLLAQSVIMLATMLVMLQLCTKVKAIQEISTRKRKFSDSHDDPLKTSSSSCKLVKPFKRKAFTDFDARYFWQWSRFIDYLLFLSLFAVTSAVINYLLISFVVYVEMIGFLAVFTEAMLGSPQFYRNFQNKSTQGMSVQMVCCWLSGDMFKTGYFIVNEAPMQFWVCGVLQVSIDIAILLQVYCYRGQQPRRSKVAPTPSSDHIS